MENEQKRYVVYVYCVTISEWEEEPELVAVEYTTATSKEKAANNVRYRMRKLYGYIDHDDENGATAIRYEYYPEEATSENKDHKSEQEPQQEQKEELQQEKHYEQMSIFDFVEEEDEN